MWVRVPYFQLINGICPYNYISNHYNLTVSKHHAFKNIKLTKKTLLITKTLYRTGVISNFILVSPKLIKFTVFFYKNSPFFKKIQLVSSQSKNFFININALVLTKKVFKSSLIILSTPKGLLTSKESISLGTGGQVIFIIN